MNARPGTLRIMAAMTLPITMAAASVALAAWLAVGRAQPTRPHVGPQVIVIDDLPPVPCPMVGNRTAC
jgi:hypothetical protein